MQMWPTPQEEKSYHRIYSPSLVLGMEWDARDHGDMNSPPFLERHHS